jgi:APA family basic amino acid/polyamine antiporter
VVGSLSALYALLGTFESIIRYFVFVATFWFVLNIASVIVHRIRRPELPRPFRVPAYPLPPLLYLGVALGLLVEIARSNPGHAAVGAGILLLSIPAYFLWEALRGGAPSSDSGRT